MTRTKYLFITLLVITFIAAGCARQEAEPKKTTPPETKPDVTTTASIVETAADFKKAISDKGTWIIAITRNITLNEDISLDGKYTNGKKDDNGNEVVQRKVALYAQDSNRNITDRYTLTAPKFTINSPEASLEHGIFKGDLYIAGKNFELKDNKVEGNVYFTNEEAQSTFSMDETSEITGKKEIKKG